MVYQNISKQSSTHLPVLIKCVQETTGPVLELGSGVFSTPFLHWLCLGRKLVTYENNPDYFQFARKFRSRNHKISLLNDWEKINLKTYWSVILIDHAPALRRSLDAIRFKNNADYIILHDSNHPEQYGYEQVWPHFKYRYDYHCPDASTTVVSNTKDLSNLIKS